jgi:hypothetical protein
MHFYEDTLQGGCGVSVLYEFTQEYSYYNKKPATIDVDKWEPQESGSGMFCASFVVGHPLSDELFTALSKKYELMWKSEPRINRNSGNMFYFAMFDAGDPGPRENDDDF